MALYKLNNVLLKLNNTTIQGVSVAPPPPFPDDCVAKWVFDSSSLADSSGNGYDLTHEGGVISYVTGKIGAKALSTQNGFGTYTGYLGYDSSALMDLFANVFGYSFTYSYWIKYGYVGQIFNATHNFTGSNPPGGGINYSDDSHIYFSPYNDTYTPVDLGAFTIGNWHHVVVTLDNSDIMGSGSYYNAYVNNSKVLNNLNVGFSYPFYESKMYLINQGSNFNFSVDYQIIDNAYIFNRILTATEVSNLYNGGTGI